MTVKRTAVFTIIILMTAFMAACRTPATEDFSPLPKPTESMPVVLSPQATDVPEPTHTQAVEQPSTPSETLITILAAGDVMAHGDNLKSAYDQDSGTYSFIENYTLVKPLVEQADLAICNLETVTAGPETGYTSYPLFNTPDAILDGLAYAGFDILVTANNHSLDRGENGILSTLSKIGNRGLAASGTYADKGTNYTVTDVKGVSISILAYTEHLNGNLPLLSEDKHFMINLMDKDSIIDDIRKAKSHSDIVLVYLHWGSEYNRQPDDWQPGYARSLTEAGADAVLGTHPHVIRPDETTSYNGETQYIIYSMGNFISNYLRADNRKNALYTEDGVLIKLSFIKDADGDVSLKEVVPIPTWPYKFSDGGGIHYEIVPVINGSTSPHADPYASNEAIASYNRTMEILKGYKKP